jgi:hypothetical protein
MEGVKKYFYKKIDEAIGKLCPVGCPAQNNKRLQTHLFTAF